MPIESPSSEKERAHELNTALTYLASGQMEVASDLLEKIARSYAEKRNLRADVFLAAVAQEQTEGALTRFVIEQGAAPEGEPGASWPPMIRAAKNGALDCLREIARHCDLKTSRNSLGHTALMAAATALPENIATLRFLLPLSDPLARDNEGLTALAHAARHGNLDALQELLPCSDPKSQDKDGSSILLQAAIHDNVECVRALLPLSDVGAKTLHGFDAFDASFDNFHWACADAFAGWIDAERAREAVQVAPPGALPALAKFVARAERETLAEALSSTESTPRAAEASSSGPPVVDERGSPEKSGGENLDSAKPSRRL
jgi:ankyrin repeat protein